MGESLDAKALFFIDQDIDRIKRQIRKVGLVTFARIAARRVAHGVSEFVRTREVVREFERGFKDRGGASGCGGCGLGRDHR